MAMADRTSIEWTDATWNVVNGCSVISPGCTNCYAMKLAGTRLRDIFEREITGLTLRDLDWADKHAYWMAAFQRTIGKGVPTQGIVKGPRVQKEHLVQYWLRLPLRTSGKGVGMVLCYDHFLTASDRLDDGLAHIA